MMKLTKINFLQYSQFICLLPLFYLSSCSTKQLAITINKAPQISVPTEIKQIVILPNKIIATNDSLHIKSQVIQDLKTQLTGMNRYSVSIGMPKQLDINRTDIGVIEGNLVSKLILDRGQFTNIATCSVGISSLGAVIAEKKSNPDITVSRYGLVCFSRTAISSLTSSVADALFADLTGYTSQVDEVYRVKIYKNISYFVQTNLTFTHISKNSRNMLVSRSSTASFSQQTLHRPENIHESSVSLPEILPLLFVPVSPLFIRSVAVVKESKREYFRDINLTLSKKEKADRAQIQKQLSQQAIMSFVHAVAPYKEKVIIKYAQGGEPKSVALIKQQKWQKAKEHLIQLQSTKADDMYNLALTYEASAMSMKDYEQAQAYYKQAFEKDSSNTMFAVALGRIERRLWLRNK